MFKIRPISAACFLLPLGLSLHAQASDKFLFDPDGPGPDQAVELNTFDWLPGSALSVNTIPLATSPAATPSTLLSHARLGNFLRPDGLVLLGTGLNSAYEITFVGGAGQLGSRSGSQAVFTFDPTNSTNFFEVYWDPNRDSNPLAGTGYNNGTLILSGVVSGATSSYFNTSLQQRFDQFITDNYQNKQSVVGSGGGQIFVDVVFANPAFFPDTTKQPKTLSFNTSQVTPFKQTDPSRLFVANPGGAAPSVTPNLGAVNGVSGPDFQFQVDANMSLTLEEIILGACRMTGGGVTVDGEITFDENSTNLAIAESDKNRYTFGGQIGAPTASQPQPSGEWTHHQFQGPAGDFVFRVGTASAPADTFVTQVTCSDPGFCSPARPAPFKQLDWSGIGSFRSAKGTIASLVNAENDKVEGYSRHFVRVHIEDLGEPGPGGKQPGSGACPHTIGTIVGDPATNPDAELACRSCADVYQIEIHATTDPNSAVIYSVGGFIDAGNLQIHPEIK